MRHRKISRKELQQLHQKPTLDDFNGCRRNRLDLVASP
jgi:hypothetical protein